MKRESLSVATVALLLVLSGCTGPLIAGSESGRIVGESDATDGAETVLDRIEGLYGLNATSKIRIVEFDREEMRSLGAFSPNVSTSVQRVLALSGEDATTSLSLGGYVGGPNPPEGGSTIVLLDDYSNTNRRSLFGDLEAEAHREIVLAHEFVHVIQGDWGFGSAGTPSTLDGRLAAKALSEGDATYTQVQYARRYTEAGQLRKAAFDEQTRTGGWKSQLLSRPYYVGYRYWATLDVTPKERNHLMVDQPETTAQLLHPAANLSSPGASLPALDLDYSSQGSANRVGELAIRIALRSNGIDDRRAARAATGWRNDTLRTYAPSTEDLSVWQVRMANASAARAFERTWLALLRNAGGDTSKDVIAISNGAVTTHYAVQRDGAVVRVVAASKRSLVLEATDAIGASGAGNESVAVDAGTLRGVAV